MTATAFEIDGARLVLGDGIDWLRRQPDNSLDGIFMDPPWGSGPKIQGQDRWRELIAESTAEAARVVKQRGPIILWVGSAMLDLAIRSVNAQLSYSALIMFRKIPPSYLGRNISPGDPILVYGKGERAQPAIRLMFGEIIGASDGKKDTTHPCARNLSAVKKLLYGYFIPGSLIADPFGGSGTTAAAAADLGIRCVSIEIDPVMHETSMRRFEMRTPNLVTPCP